MPAGILNYNPNPLPPADNAPYDFGPNPHSVPTPRQMRQLVAAIERKTNRATPPLPEFNLSGETVHDLGSHLLNLLASFCRISQAAPLLSPRITSSPNEWNAFLNSATQRAVKTSQSSGIGVARGVILEALFYAQHGERSSWRQLTFRAGGMIPIWKDANHQPEELDTLFAVSRLATIQIGWTSDVATGINFWLAAVSLLGPKALIVPYQVIAVVDPPLAKTMLPWFKTTKRTNFTGLDRRTECEDLWMLLGPAGLQLNPIQLPKTGRTQKQHDQYTVRLMSTLIFGGDAFLKSPEFQAVKEGCDYPFYDECRLSTVSHCDMVSFLHTEITQGYNGPLT